MLNQIIQYFQKMFGSFEKPQTYSSELEAYIVRHCPQNTYDVERLTRQFDLQQSHKAWLL